MLTFVIKTTKISMKTLCQCDCAMSRYVSCVLGCPFEGPIAPSKVAEVSRACIAAVNLFILATNNFAGLFRTKAINVHSDC